MESSNKSFTLDSIYFNPTQKCNLRCRHCWISPDFCPGPDSYLPEEEHAISLEELKPAIEEALSLGLTNIKITGGEPLLRRNILDFIRFFNEKDLSLIIETNGTLLDKEIIGVLKQSKIDTISLSLDSIHSRRHDGFRGRRGSFALVIQGIEGLVKAGIHPQVIISLHRENAEELNEIISLAKQLGASSVKINPIISLGQGKKMHRMKEVLELKEILELNKRIEEEYNGSSNFMVFFDVPLAFKSTKGLLKGLFSSCGILNILGILADGSISFCGIGRTEEGLIMGNVRSDSLRDIWFNHPILQKIRREVPSQLQGVCGRCIMKRSCLGGCRAEVYSRHKNLKMAFPFCAEAEEKGLFPETRIRQELCSNVLLA